MATRTIHLNKTPLGVYTGPGDIATLANWRMWWGLRAFTLAGIGGNVMDLVRNDAATITITTITGGGLDMATLTPWMSGHTAKVTKMYDQTGNGNHIVQATDAVRPALTMNGLNSKPVITFSGGQCLSVPSLNGIFDIAAPFGYSLVCMSTGTLVSVQNNIMESNSGILISANVFGHANEFRMSGNTAFTATAADNVYHAVQGQFNDASSDLYIDGVSNPGDVGTGYSIVAAQQFRWGADSDDGSSQPFTGATVEGGVYQANYSSFKSAVNSNQTTYWGPF